MQYIEKFIISDNLSIVINHDDDNEEKTVLIEKSVNGKVRTNFQETFDNDIKKLEFNEEYLVFTNRNFILKDTNLKVIALNTGEEITEQKLGIYREVSKVNKYGTFEVKCFPIKIN